MFFAATECVVRGRIRPEVAARVRASCGRRRSLRMPPFAALHAATAAPCMTTSLRSEILILSFR